MQYDVLIPTCKDKKELLPMFHAVEDTVDESAKIIFTSMKVSASVNRNYALSLSKAEYVVMVDDDISGFYHGWADKLLTIFTKLRNVSMVSARLMNKDMTPGCMMSIEPQMELGYQIVDGYLPSACIAFRNDGTRFDENFEGSGWEDTDFCDSLHVKYPNGLFIIDNNVKLIHANEMKNGGSSAFEKNKQYYMKKHGGVS